jgi:phosphatidylserine/phosphatidylglycerophosphate/cardiolipin synthase-like enzyme
VLSLLLIIDLMFVASRLGGARTSTAGYVVFFGGELLLASAIVALLDVQEELEKRAEPNRDILEPLNAIEANTAVWAFHPVSFNDNPVHIPLPLGLEQVANKLGFWHQKLQLVKRPPDADGNEFIAYIGGIDVNPNRRDAPGHQISGPYHDVQARVTGPGAADIFFSFEERWLFHAAEDDPQNAIPPAFGSPSPASLAAQPARHIVQVGRTYYLPHPAVPETERPFQFSRNGDTSIYDTMVRAIKSAR